MGGYAHWLVNQRQASVVFQKLPNRDPARGREPRANPRSPNGTSGVRSRLKTKGLGCSPRKLPAPEPPGRRPEQQRTESQPCRTESRACDRPRPPRPRRSWPTDSSRCGAGRTADRPQCRQACGSSNRADARCDRLSSRRSSHKNPGCKHGSRATTDSFFTPQQRP